MSQVLEIRISPRYVETINELLENGIYASEEGIDDIIKDVLPTFELITELPASIKFIPSLFHSLHVRSVREELGVNKNEVKYRVDIYIGSDNDSRKIHDSYLDKVREWSNKTFPDGYTLIRGEGYYNGTSEDSLLLHAFFNYDPSLNRQLQRLKRHLRQSGYSF